MHAETRVHEIASTGPLWLKRWVADYEIDWYDGHLQPDIGDPTRAVDTVARAIAHCQCDCVIVNVDEVTAMCLRQLGCSDTDDAGTASHVDNVIDGAEPVWSSRESFYEGSRRGPRG